MEKLIWINFFIPFKSFVLLTFRVKNNETLRKDPKVSVGLNFLLRAKKTCNEVHWRNFILRKMK